MDVGGSEHQGEHDFERYFLMTERIGFRRWLEADLELAMGLWGDVEVTRLIGGPFTTAQVQERLRREMANQVAHGFQYWPIFRRQDDAHLGCCGLRPYDLEHRVLEMGFHLRVEYWRQGYGEEAARAVIAHAFGALGAVALVAGHNPANQGSRRLIEKLGFRCAGSQFYPPTGLHHPRYLLTAGEYAAGHGLSDC
jgi:[ribosomal protein S5]-alanine N-acetyltransferase